MNLFNIRSIISFLLLCLTLIDFASAASVHGHPHHHAQENTPKVPHQHFQINETLPNLNSVTAEPAKAQQRQRHPLEPLIVHVTCCVWIKNRVQRIER